MLSSPRFIPVYTGNTSSFKTFSTFKAVYPCVYREHVSRLSQNSELAGLSLCIQGTLFLVSTNDIISRFIPVYTGNTTRKSNGSFATPVYPCVYREHYNFQLVPANFAGLSLCIQGTQLANQTAHLPPRFIPVYTGNTKSLMIYTVQKPVYPCVYREHSKYI